MSSILTNMSAMSAVANLTATQKSLAATENQISTGLAVSSAKDNAAYWSIATIMRTQNNDLSAVTDSLNLGSSVVGTASAALGTMISVLQKMSADVVTVQQAGTDATAVQADIAQLQNQISNAVTAASFNGVNLLNGTHSGTGSSISIVASVTGSGANTAVEALKVAGYDFTSTGTISTALTMDVTTASSGQLATYLSAVGSAISSLETASENLGAVQKNIELQTTFISALSDSIATGIGSFVDADMNQASTRLSALQTQQQLGVQALSVANQNSQLILKLFGG